LPLGNKKEKEKLSAEHSTTNLKKDKKQKANISLLQKIGLHPSTAGAQHFVT